jgi:hypothetical protein
MPRGKLVSIAMAGDSFTDLNTSSVWIVTIAGSKVGYIRAYAIANIGLLLELRE